ALKTEIIGLAIKDRTVILNPANIIVRVATSQALFSAREALAAPRFCPTMVADALPRLKYGIWTS
ncbi:unnamed protein product, partial [marine sediment metagenome]